MIFRAPRLRAVPALRSSLLLYRKGFVLLPFKNGVEIAALEGVAASIDRRAVPKAQECPCRDPGTGGDVLEPTRDIRGSKNRFLIKSQCVLVEIRGLSPACKDVCVTHFITRSSR